MTMYDIIKKNGDAERVLNAILKNTLKHAQAGNSDDVFLFLTKWDGAVMMYNKMMGYSNNLYLNYEEDMKIQGYIKRILYRH